MDQSRTTPLLADTLEQFYPGRYHLVSATAATGSPSANEELASALAERWGQLAGKPASDCVRILLTCTRKWALFGATLFDVKVRIVHHHGGHEARTLLSCERQQAYRSLTLPLLIFEPVPLPCVFTPVLILPDFILNIDCLMGKSCG